MILEEMQHRIEILFIKRRDHYLADNEKHQYPKSKDIGAFVKLLLLF
jgi:hypothetical protein